jgi:hypothetical protein
MYQAEPRAKAKAHPAGLSGFGWYCFRFFFLTNKAPPFRGARAKAVCESAFGFSRLLSGLLAGGWLSGQKPPLSFTDEVLNVFKDWGHVLIRDCQVVLGFDDSAEQLMRLKFNYRLTV